MMPSRFPSPSDAARATLASVAADVARATPEAAVPLPEPATLLLTALAHHDSSAYVHSLRVGALAWYLARQLAYRRWEQHRLWLAGLLHDVGMINVPRSLLRRGVVTPAERGMLLRHPLDGARLVGWHGALAALAPSIAAHHERPDGYGYPQRLRRAQIPPDAAVLAVVEAVDNRVWRVPATAQLQVPELCTWLLAGAGTAWDPTVIRAVVESLGQTGTWARGASTCASTAMVLPAGRWELAAADIEDQYARLDGFHEP